jgi:hypothetical protein
MELPEDVEVLAVEEPVEHPARASAAARAAAGKVTDFLFIIGVKSFKASAGASASRGLCVLAIRPAHEERRAGSAGQVTARALFYVRLMQSSPGERLPGR